jgi:hypothetical protein
LKLLQEWGRRIKESDGGGEFNYGIRTFVNVTMHPQYNNNNKYINKKEKTNINCHEKKKWCFNLGFTF